MVLLSHTVNTTNLFINTQFTTINCITLSITNIYHLKCNKNDYVRNYERITSTRIVQQNSIHKTQQTAHNTEAESQSQVKPSPVKYVSQHIS